MADAWAEEQPGGGRVDRLLARLPLSSLWLGVVVLAALVAAYLASAAGLGQLELLRGSGQPLGLARGARYDLVLAVLIAYTVAVARVGRRGAVRDYVALGPVLRLPEPEHARLVRGAVSPDRRPLAASMGAGALFGLGLELLTREVLAPELALGTVLSAWGVVLNVCLFALLGRMSYLSLRAGRTLSMLGRTATQVRLLDPASREPFARAGLRGAAFWFVGSSIASLLVFEAVAPGVVGLVLVLTVTIGSLALILPARGIQRAVREAKQAELARVRRALEAERGRLTDPLSPETVARLPVLLAWEARIDAVHTWPFDTPTLLRFALFLLLPLGSWIGGAIVERLLDVWLD